MWRFTCKWCTEEVSQKKLVRKQTRRGNQPSIRSCRRSLNLILGRTWECAFYFMTGLIQRKQGFRPQGLRAALELGWGDGAGSKLPGSWTSALACTMAPVPTGQSSKSRRYKLLESKTEKPREAHRSNKRDLRVCVKPDGVRHGTEGSRAVAD